MKRLIALTLALLLASMSAALAHTRREVRDAFGAIRGFGGETPYAALPLVRPPYESGELLQEARDGALDYLNFARWLAGLEPVTESGIYDYQCQHGAVLLAALDYVDHNAPQPGDMEKNFYDSAHIATSSGCIARFNWMRQSILREGVEYFLRDDGDGNLQTLGHRRWALNPTMAATGFGLANSESGMSYVVMYAHDLGAPDAQWDRVCWPAEGAFPAELIHDHLAWSIMLNPGAYDLGSLDAEITLTESVTGMRFRFRPAQGTGDGFCAVNLDGYGAGPCLIFRPDFSGMGFTDYQQNQRWTVRVEGLAGPDGEAKPIEYEVDMIALTPQDAVNVELSPLELTLSPGQGARLRADVIPAWADDLSVTWRSTDESVAAVDGDGAVTAIGPGRCEIVAACAGGFEDACAVTVE